ncbi:hypothetical protein H9P43_004261 [Blastocladiella emersonii ATCC 22665]|nr:hypothetical protein H9P43_004261 [Blastocladiella emersonii ATCC 22665]
MTSTPATTSNNHASAVVPLTASFDAAPLRGATLVLPTVSTGNVPQLVADLLASTLGDMARVGDLGSPYVLNLCGPDAFGRADQVAMPLEVYHSPAANLAVLQLRTPVIQGYGGKFTRAVWDWAAAAGVARIVVLASADAAYRSDHLIEGTPSFRQFALGTGGTDDTTPSSALFASAAKPLEPEHRSGLLRGAGILAPLVAVAGKAGIPTDVLVTFTLEGDNLPDTMMVWSKVHAALGLADAARQPRVPASWAELYGAALAPAVARDVY